jgi:hypothetical protein
MATGTTLINKIRPPLQDATDTSFSNADLLRYINEGATKFCATTGCLQDTANIATNNSAYSFTASGSLTNMVVVYALQFNGTPLSRTFIHEVSYKFGDTSGTPDENTRWYEFGGVIYVEIIPPTATGSSALNAFYVRTPTDLAGLCNRQSVRRPARQRS